MRYKTQGNIWAKTIQFFPHNQASLSEATKVFQKDIPKERSKGCHLLVPECTFAAEE